MPAAPLRSFKNSAVSFRTGPAGSNLWQMDTGSGAVDTTTIGSYAGLATGWRQFQPGVSNSTAGAEPADPATATDKGWREESRSHPQGAGDPTEFPSQNWTLTFNLSQTGTTAIVLDYLVIVYKVPAGSGVGAGAQLWRRKRTGQNLLGLNAQAQFTESFNPGVVSLGADEILQAEVWLNVTTNSNATTIAVSLRVNDGITKLDPTSDVILKAARTSTDSTAGLTDVTSRIFLPQKATADSIPLSDSVARVFKPQKATADSATVSDVTTRVLMPQRSTSDSIAGLTDSLTRQLRYTRTPPDTLSISDATARSTAAARGVSDTAPATDSTARTVSFRRTEADTIPAASDVVTKQFRAVRLPTDTAPATDQVTRTSGRFARTPSDSISLSDVVTRIINFGRIPRDNIGGPADYPIDFPLKAISGVVKDGQGNPVAGATVKLFRTQDDFMAASTTSAADGSYSFPRDLFDPYQYWTLAYTEAGTQKHGASDRSYSPV